MFKGVIAVLGGLAALATVLTFIFTYGPHHGPQTPSGPAATGNPSVFVNPTSGAPPNGCAAGYVPRNAVSGDNVCVTPAEESQVVYDNSQEGLRVSPSGGPYGPATCQTGYVWREATPKDMVCVTPETRTITAAENADPHLTSAIQHLLVDWDVMVFSRL